MGRFMYSKLLYMRRTDMALSSSKVPVIPKSSRPGTSGVGMLDMCSCKVKGKEDEGEQGGRGRDEGRRDGRNNEVEHQNQGECRKESQNVVKKWIRRKTRY